MTSTSAIEGVKISNINLVNPRLRIPYGNPEFHIKISSKGKGETSITTVKKNLDGDRVIWDESFSFAETDADSILAFQVFKTRLRQRKLVGTLEKKVGELISLQNDRGSCTLDVGRKSGQLTFSIELQHAILRDIVDEASETSARLSTVEGPAKIANALTSAHNTFANQEDTWTSFLSQFQIFMNVVDKIAEVHPYAKLAWSILAFIPKTIKSLKDRNESVKQLYEKLKETYDFITDAERLPKLNETQVGVLSILVQQTIECGYFIRDYTSGNIVEKVWKGANIDEKVKAFIGKLDHIKKVMIHATVLETSIVTLRASETVSEIKELTLLSEMPYARDAGFVSGKRCLPGTRQDLLQELMSWVNENTAQRVLVLSGGAGTGKSAVAHTIAEIFRQQNRLGSLFCFSRSYKDRRSSLFSTISRGLADTDVLWRKGLMRVIEDTAIRTSTDMETQFKELIVKPAQGIGVIGPVVIVIDALDESGDRAERKALLDILFNQLPTLPTNYRILLTTRPEADIEPRCQSSTVICKRMGDIAAARTLSDIKSYVSFRLHEIVETLDKIQSDWRDVLAKRSEGLFQWAETVCRFIDPTVRKPSLVRKRWKACTSGSSTSLFELYHDIISSQRESRDPEFVDDFKKLISAVMTAREPLTVHTLEVIFQGIIEDVKMTLEPFGSLLMGVHDSFTPVQPLHTSLFDFFHSQSQGEAKKENQYYVDTSDQSLFALGCLRLLTRTLRFNICDLTTSHRRNRDIPDLDAKVKEVIPPELSYACRFWAVHLRESRNKRDLVSELRTLMHEKLLYLFEVLGLFGMVEEGCVAMRIVRSWCKDVDNELAGEAQEACQFGVDFGEVMTESTPHLYLSALPFTPSNSFISKQFLPMFPQLFSIDVGQSLCSPTQAGLVKRKKPLSAVGLLVFSPRDKHIATAFDDGTLRIFDYETGEIVCEWKREIFRISDIVFSPDGRLVYWCFGDATIQIYNIYTKEVVEESYQEVHDEELYQGIHDEESYQEVHDEESHQEVHDEDSESQLSTWPCRYTISSDGRYIALSDGNTGVLYDRENRRKLTQWEDSGHKLAFSPNGSMFAFPVDAANGTKLWVWDTRKQALGPSLKTPEMFQIFRLGDKHVAFGSDTEIEVWDIPTLTKIRTLPKYSPVCFINDEYLVTYPGNGYNMNDMYSIWNVSTGECIVKASFAGIRHFRVAFHYSKKLIALSTWDGAVHIREWDAPVESKTPDEVRGVYPIAFWLRGRCLIHLYGASLRISDVRTANNTVFDAQSLSMPVVTVPPSDIDGRVYVAYCTVNQLHLWSNVEGDLILDEGMYITPGQFSTAGDRLISLHDFDTVKIWDTSTCALIGGPYTFITYWVHTLAFSATSDNFLVAYGALNNTTVVEVRECQSGRIAKGPFEISECPSKIAFSAEETRIVCLSRRRINILDTHTGKSEVSLFHYRLFPRLSRNGKYATWFLNENEIMIWDIDHGVQLQTLSFNGSLRSFFFSDDSAQIMAFYFADDDGYHFDIWDVSAEKTTSRTMGIYIAPEHDYLQVPVSDQNFLGFLPDNDHVATVLDLSVHKIMTLLYKHHLDHSGFGMLPVPTIHDLNGSTSDNKEILEYALTAWNKALFSQTFQRKDSNGWMLGPHGELLFWVPKNRRRALWRPCVAHIGAKDFTKLNFDKFVHGSRWTECKGTT